MVKLDSDNLKAIKDLIEVSFEEVAERKELVTKDHLGNLPTKDEFFGKMDEVMGELKAIREEVSIRDNQVSDHEDRIEKIETHIGMQSD